MDYSLPSSSVHEILQARILEWVAIPFSRESSWPGHWTQVSSTAGRLFTVWALREEQASRPLQFTWALDVYHVDDHSIFLPHLPFSSHSSSQALQSQLYTVRELVLLLLWQLSVSLRSSSPLESPRAPLSRSCTLGATQEVNLAQAHESMSLRAATYPAQN